MKERSIAYFEVVESRNGEQLRTGQRSWQQALEALETAPIEARSWESDRSFIGSTELVEGERHLLLHRVRDMNEWLSVIDFSTGRLEELESAASQGYLDTTAVTFLPYGNVISIMRGSTSAPTHKSIEGWLNHLGLFSGEAVVRPLLRAAEVERLRTATGASRIEIRIGANRAAALQGRQGRLATFLRAAHDDFGDLRVTLTISVPRGGHTRDEDREGLLEELRSLSDVMPQAAEFAKAHLTYNDPTSGNPRTHITEFIEHEITLKRRVPAVDEDGNSIRIRAAFQVMVGANAEVEDELREASAAED